MRIPDYNNGTLLLGTSAVSTINAFSYIATEDCWIYAKGYPASGTDFKIHVGTTSGPQLLYLSGCTASAMFPLKKGTTIITAVGGSQNISWAEVRSYPYIK